MSGDDTTRATLAQPEARIDWARWASLGGGLVLFLVVYTRCAGVFRFRQ